MNHALSPRDHHQGRDTLPWYRYPLLWLVIALPACAAIAAISTVVIAVRHADDPVLDEWYREGRIINRTQEKEQLAERLGIHLQLSALGGDIHARLTSGTAFPWPAQLTLNLRHPTLAREDQELVLLHQGDGLYRATAGFPAQGDWQVTLTPDTRSWRLYQRRPIVDGQLSVGHGRG